ncbi:hypothetical protein HY045_04010 [Candidatus Woesebacteria bacterium]|nr:hypothetical protein [Candidatus Woesebacteria bacterium]
MKFSINIRLGFILVLLISALFIAQYSLSNIARAEPDCSNPSFGEIDYCLQKIQGEINALSPAQQKNKQDLAGLRKQLSDLSSRITNISNQVKKLQGQIVGREEDLAYAKEIFEQKTQNHYVFIRLYDPIMPFLEAGSATEAFREISFRQKAADEDIKTMEGYANDLTKLKSDKSSLEKSKTQLAAVQKQVNDKTTFLQGEVDKVDVYLNTLSSKQQELQALKAGGFETSVGDTPPTLEPCSGPPGSSNFCDPGFRPAFGGFSFGAPHRTGMSQFGAYGRSKSGQSAETILSAYYQGSSINKSYPETAIITVSGRGTVSFEDNYLLGIYEVPESWGDSGGYEALKAQAVAARTYALYYTNNGSRSICTTEACQVYKPQLKSGKWAQAVRDTRGWVLIKDGQIAPAYFASTSGGYTISQWGWNGIKDAAGSWPDSAYEKIAGSPWFYKGWYASRGGATCGRSNPWLNSTETADILNSWKVLYQGGGDASRISPVGSCWGGNPYSVGDLQGIGGFNSVFGVSVVYGNDGSTISVNFQTNQGSVNIKGDEFKKAFNLRAPGYIGLKSSLFNIEKL